LRALAGAQELLRLEEDVDGALRLLFDGDLPARDLAAEVAILKDQRIGTRVFDFIWHGFYIEAKTGAVDADQLAGYLAAGIRDKLIYVFAHPPSQADRQLLTNSGVAFISLTE
jgi:hypothetical protein